jgi:excisionase family DNA binding protein
MTVEKMVLSEFSTIKEVGKGFGVSRSYLKSLESKKIINFYRLGGKVFIKLSEIERALKDSCKGCK